MTKPRPPVSFTQAISRIGGHLGWERAAEAVNSVRTRPLTARAVQNWSDDRTGALPTVEDALQLDLAYLAAGGEEAPLLAVLALRLKLALEATPDTCIAAAASEAAKESGEAVSALVTASLPGATPADRALARREAEEAIESLTKGLRALDAADTS